MVKYFVKGGGEVSLTDRDFIAKGGEGSIYGKGNMAYKIYEDPHKMIPYAKIAELSTLNHPNIIKPELLLMDSKNNIIGYTMKLVKNTHSVCELFTKAFKQRHNLSNKNIISLIKKFQELITHIHHHKILVVDLNELNFLTNKSFDDIYAIDVNSYQTPNFPATAIMENIRDRHSSKFNELTDWFSWAIVSFQMLIGIHPYKGKYQPLEHLPMDQRINERMLKNISVFNPDVRVPAVAEPFDSIPQALRSWYQAIFDNGNRIEPPKDYEAIAQLITKVKQIVGSNLFDITLIQEFDSEILNYFHNGGSQVVFTRNNAFFNKKQLNLQLINEKIIFSPRMNLPLALKTNNGMAEILNISNGTNLQINTYADDIMVYDNRGYIRNGTDILEIEILEIGTQLKVMTTHVANVLDLPEATKVYDGVIIQNLLGSYYATILPEKGKSYQIKLSELIDHKIIEAKFQNNVLVVVGIKKDGTYNRFVIRFDEIYQKYDCRIVENISYTGLNFTVGDQGICILLNEEEKLEIFRNKKGSSSLQIMDDKAITGDMTFYHKGIIILMADGNKLYSIKMK